MATQGFSKSAVMVLKTIKALDGYTLTGLSVTELSKKLETSQVNVTRYLNASISEGLVRKLESGRYALGVGWIQIAQTATSDLLKARDEINDTLQRIATR